MATGCTCSSSRPGPEAGSSGSSSAAGAANSDSVPLRSSPLGKARELTLGQPDAGAVRRRSSRRQTPRPECRRSPKPPNACSNRSATAGAAGGTHRNGSGAWNGTPSPASAAGPSPKSTRPTCWRSDLACQSGDGQGSPPAHPVGAGVGGRHGLAQQQPMRSGALPVLGARNDIVTHRQALHHKDVAAAIETVRGVAVRTAGRQAGVQVSGAHRGAVGGSPPRHVDRDQRGGPRVDRSSPADESEERAPSSVLRPGSGGPRRVAGARRRQSARVSDAERAGDRHVDATQDAPAPRDRVRRTELPNGPIPPQIAAGACFPGPCSRSAAAPPANGRPRKPRRSGR